MQLIRTAGLGGYELYNIERNLTETTDLSGVSPES